ncbi:MAG TPA: cation diffusion facilitator family transporter [Ktedonobacterales bacterium]|nr:cation diffusion facilitator family transporter [Ktedonobacterales bacterium]
MAQVSSRSQAHRHTHGPPTFADSTGEGLRAVYISTAGMVVVAAVEFAFFALANSAGLLSDALHNLGDVFTTVALWFAFRLAARPVSRRYTYGFHRAEDLAGAFIALVIVVSAVAAAYESYQRLVSGSTPSHIGWGIAAALFGFAGNEVLAQYKLRVGRRINSQPLIADGQHSRTDGLTSLAAAVGLALAGWFGLRAADPIAGLIISIAILYILVEIGRDVFNRLMDSVEPHVVDEIEAQARAVEGVRGVADVRARWAGRRLLVALNVAADSSLTLADGHAIAERVRQEVLAHVQGAATVDIHVDPWGLPDDQDPHRWQHDDHHDDHHEHDGHVGDRAAEQRHDLADDSAGTHAHDDRHPQDHDAPLPG